MKHNRLIAVLIFCLGFAMSMLVLLGGAYQSAQANPDAILCVAPGGTGCASPCSATCYASVQAAVDAATASDDEIRVAQGVYTGVQTIAGVKQVVYINKSVAIRGGYSTANWSAPFPLTHPTTLDAQRLGRVVYISGNITPTLEGLVIAHGNATGQLADCPSNPDGCGGGVFVLNSHPLILNNTITNNVATLTTTGNPTVAIGYGGGLYLVNANRAVISGNLVISNAASTAYRGDGGGMYLWGTGIDMQVLFNQVLSNAATTMGAPGYGGGISGGPDNALIQGNVVAGNQANSAGTGFGAGLFQYGGTAHYLGNLVQENYGSNAVGLQYSRARFEGNRVMDNAATVGITLWSKSGNGPVFVNNVVARNGSRALSFYGSASNILTATLLHNTLVGAGSGYGIYAQYANIYLTNTVIANATWGITNTTPASSNVLADHTLFWANTHDGIRGINPVDGNPAFTADGYHILTGSAAYNRGADTSVMTDIDGDPRPDSCSPDIGADELSTGLACWHVYLPLVLRNY